MIMQGVRFIPPKGWGLLCPLTPRDRFFRSIREMNRRKYEKNTGLEVVNSVDRVSNKRIHIQYVCPFFSSISYLTSVTRLPHSSWVTFSASLKPTDR